MLHRKHCFCLVRRGFCLISSVQIYFSFASLQYWTDFDEIVEVINTMNRLNDNKGAGYERKLESTSIGFTNFTVQTTADAMADTISR